MPFIIEWIISTVLCCVLLSPFFLALSVGLTPAILFGAFGGLAATLFVASDAGYDQIRNIRIPAFPMFEYLVGLFKKVTAPKQKDTLDDQLAKMEELERRIAAMKLKK